MTVRLTLEEFGSATSASNTRPGQHSSPSVSSETFGVETERARADGYESGYKAGWDDAAKSMSDEKARVEAEFARNLENLGFTFQEARSHVLTTLEPLLMAMLEALLPKIAHEAMASLISEELLPLAEAAADTPIQVLVSPESSAALAPLLDAVTCVPFEIVDKDTLPDGQIYLRSPTSERRIDLTSALERMTEVIRGFYQVNEEAFDYG